MSLTRTLSVVALAFAAGFGLNAALQTDVSARQDPVKARAALEKNIGKGTFEQVAVHVYEFQPGAVLPWHTHPGAHEVAYILEGSLTLEADGQGAHVFKTGDVSYLAPDVVHRGLADSKRGVKLVAVRLKPKDSPLVSLVQGR
jgi:quercetin dioxygenase-like cupin family protein